MMRKLLILLILPCFVKAQHEWDSMLMDSVPFHNIFGTEKEFQIQSSNQLSSKNGWRVFFIGYKWGYLNNLEGFLKERGWTVTTKVDSAVSSYTFKRHIKNDSLNHMLLVTVHFNDDQRIIKVTIKSTQDSDIINLYKEFWESPDISLNNLKANEKSSFKSGTDEVSLIWRKHKPVIRISN